ncbi:hypothetical protein OIU78_012478 [Salix suchowensis]|nr:hypothetical protein OIU78_012478 [Salix suchowensis]
MRKPQRDFLLLGCQNPRGNIQGRDRQAETEATFSGAARQISRPHQRQAEGPVRRPVAPPLRAPSSPAAPSPPLNPLSPPSPSSPVAPPPKPAAQVAVDDKNAITLEFQRQKAKELQQYFKQKKLEKADQGPFFGFVGNNEIANGR